LPTNEYAGRVHAVYSAEKVPGRTETHVFTEGHVIALFASRGGAERYVIERENNDAFSGRDELYSIVPWLVKR
jgi:hypothetical protein